MKTDATAIHRQLDIVAGERRKRAADKSLSQRVQAIKAYQHRRFESMYADLLRSPRFGAAARFFLDDLYGPHDFEQRDSEFARVVPTLVRLFPGQLVGTVLTLVELHAMSEVLDTTMAESSDQPVGTEAQYRSAWRRTGLADSRRRQIELVGQIGRSLDRYVRNPLLRHSLRMMRQPAAMAGLGALQSFLETGFDTFRKLKGADEFLQTIDERERAYVEAMNQDNGDES